MPTPYLPESGNSPHLPKNLTSFFIHFLKPHRTSCLSLIGLSLVIGIMMSAHPYALKLLIDTAMHHHRQDFGLAIVWPAMTYIGSTVMIGALWRLHEWVVLSFVPVLKRDIQAQMFGYAQGHSCRYFQDHFAGSLANKISDMARGVANILLTITDDWLLSFFGIFVAVGILYTVAPMFAWMLGIWALVFVGVVYQLSKQGQGLSMVYSQARSTVFGRLVDSLGNAINVRIFARGSEEVHRLRQDNADVIKKEKAFLTYALKTKIFQNISFTVLVLMMITLLTRAYMADQITPGDFALVLTLCARMVDHLHSVAKEFLRFSEDIGTCRQALDIVIQPHDIVDQPGAMPLVVQKGKIIFDQVVFGYQSTSLLFDHLSLEISPGQKVGLVGFSGGGKTSFVHLLMRFFDPQSGQILIDGQVIHQVRQASLREAIAMIPQDTSLFHRSLLENIRYGRTDATDEEVQEAAKQAHCHEFIQTLPAGYESLVGERGIKLSGGQRQRIAIARAILKNAPILILDEATSSLDSVTESLIQNSLRILMQGRTTIVIAHRLSTLSEMDRLLLFDQGRIVGDGTHAMLLQTSLHYATIWQTQANGFL